LPARKVRIIDASSLDDAAEPGLADSGRTG
jgi:hypothetical protein